MQTAKFFRPKQMIPLQTGPLRCRFFQIIRYFARFLPGRKDSGKGIDRLPTRVVYSSRVNKRNDKEHLN